MNDKGNTSRQWRNPLVMDNVGAQRVAGSLLSGNILRDKVTAGWALGCFLIELPCPSTMATLSLAGFDFTVLDMEHSTIDFSTLEPLITAGHASGCTSLVRIWGEDTGLIGKVLDMGANGIMVPHVANAQRARAVVDQARFAPLGNRGFSPLTKFDALPQPLDSLNDSAYVVIQIEGREAIENIEEITAVDGVDAVFVGPYDLALSLGVEPWSEVVYEKAAQFAQQMPPGRALGIYIDDPSTCGQWAELGFALQCVSFDGRMLADGARSIATRAAETVTLGSDAE